MKNLQPDANSKIKCIAPKLPLLGEDRSPELYDSIVKQTRDAIAQTGFTKVVLGLSGGLDSALVAAIAVDALALDNIPAQNVHGIIMPSQWTSDTSVKDAKELAENLGIQTEVFDIMPAYSAMKDTLAPAFAEAQEDITEENLQVRIRALYLMAMSNKFDLLVLSTNNLSETTVGYTTLYGDTIGAFAPLAPLYKSWVFELAHYRNKRMQWLGKDSLIPASILEKEPSAELAPNQTDEAVLGPYSYLDALLHTYFKHCKDSGKRKRKKIRGKYLGDEQRYDREKVLSDSEVLFDLGFDKEYAEEIVARIEKAVFKRQFACPGAVLPSAIQSYVKRRS